MTWLGLFGAFFGGVVRGWIGETPKRGLDPLTPEDQEDEINAS